MWELFLFLFCFVLETTVFASHSLTRTDNRVGKTKEQLSVQKELL